MLVAEAEPVERTGTRGAAEGRGRGSDGLEEPLLARVNIEVPVGVEVAVLELQRRPLPLPVRPDHPVGAAVCKRLHATPTGSSSDHRVGRVLGIRASDAERS